jgi:nucleoside-diphosphate-sugar epimerase
MKHLVTGSSGFLGSSIVKALVEKKQDVVSVDIIEDQEISKISNFFKLDISSKHTFYKEVFKDVRYVHHNAALVPLSKAGKDFYKVNVLGTRNILEESIKNNVSHFSHMSSSAIFGKPQNNKNVNSKVYKPTSDYGHSKYLAELEVVKKFNSKEKFFKSCSIIRPRPIIGKERLGIFEILFDWIKDDKKIPIIGSGENIFQFSHVDDLAEVSIETAMRGVSGFFNIGTDKYGRLKDDLNEMLSRVESKSKLIFINEKLCILLLYILDKMRLSPLSSWHYLSYSWNFYYELENSFEKLNWRPKKSNVDMLTESYIWYLKNQNNLKYQKSKHKSKVRQKLLRIIKFFL